MRSFNLRLFQVKNCMDAKKILLEMGASFDGQEIMWPKTLFFTLVAENISDPAANILKQEMLSLGGDAVIHRDALVHKTGAAPVLLIGTLKQLKGLITKIKDQPFKLSSLSRELDIMLQNLTNKSSLLVECLHGPLVLGKRTLIMGILNVTPDSFSDGGKFYNLDNALEHALQMVEEGADIIDVGGESTRPGFAEVSAEEEIARILPVIKLLSKYISVPISVDTYKAEVGRRALGAGAAIINDVWGFRKEPELARVAAEYDCPVVLMHNQTGTEYKNLMGDIFSLLRNSIELAETSGVKQEKIFIDPGIGFGKNLEQNLEVLNHLEEFKSLGKPILLGTSRKSLIGKVLDLAVSERMEGTAATVAVGIAKGADIVRVHNVKEMVRVARMTDAIVRR